MVLGPEASTLILCRKWLKMQILGLHPRPGAWHSAVRSPPGQILMVLRANGDESHSGTKHIPESVESIREHFYLCWNLSCDVFNTLYAQCPTAPDPTHHIKKWSMFILGNNITPFWDIFNIKRKMLQIVTPIVLCRIISSWLPLDKGHQGKLLIR